MSGLHDGHRERVLRQFSENEFEGMLEHQILELILFFSVPRADTNPIAHALLNRYHTIAAVMDAPAKELKKFPGITDRTVQLFHLILATSRHYEIEKKRFKSYLTTTDEIGTYLLSYFSYRPNESLVLISLNNKQELLNIDCINEGSPNSVNIDTRRVLEIVLQTHANNVIVAHNHPGGLAYPSDDDIQATQLLRDTLTKANVRLLDHIIVSDDQYISLKEISSLKILFD